MYSFNKHELRQVVFQSSVPNQAKIPAFTELTTES
jgi:hypothetical protein